MISPIPELRVVVRRLRYELSGADGTVYAEVWHRDVADEFVRAANARAGLVEALKDFVEDHADNAAGRCTYGGNGSECSKCNYARRVLEGAGIVLGADPTPGPENA